MSRAMMVARVMVAPAGTEPWEVGHLIEAGKGTYEAVSPWEDLGICTGSYRTDNELRTVEISMSRATILDRLNCETFAFAIIFQDKANRLRGWVYPVVCLEDLFFPPPREGQTSPLIVKRLSELVTI